MKQLNTSITPESEKDCAQTPWWFVKSLESFFSVKFQTDVCCRESTTKAPRFYSLEDGINGLDQHWYEYNFCNPPFSNTIPWIKKAFAETASGCNTAMILPDNTETQYLRLATDLCDTVIRMPFRLSFLRSNGEPFLTPKGKKQGPQFPIAVFWFTRLGSKSPTRTIYHDFRLEPYGKELEQLIDKDNNDEL